MARVQLKDSWVCAAPYDTATQRVREFLNQHQMKVVSSEEGEVVADQGSQLTTRFIGGWLGNPANFPKRATIRLHSVELGASIEATIEETLGFGWLDPRFQKRYEDYFKQWMNALRNVLPPTSSDIVSGLPSEAPSASVAMPPPPPSDTDSTPQSSTVPAAQPSYPQPPYPAFAPRPPKDRGIALILEILPGLFGLLGLGWIYSGNTNTGFKWLVGVLVWHVFALIIDIGSAGFGCFLCHLPVNLVLLAISASSLNTYTRQHSELFGE